jgi:hypothetical protein
LDGESGRFFGGDFGLFDFGFSDFDEVMTDFLDGCFPDISDKSVSISILGST